MNAAHEETVEGLTVKVWYEENASYCDPRDDSNIGTMLCWHPNYALGDVQFQDAAGRGAIGDKPRDDAPYVPGERRPRVKTEHEHSGRFKSLEAMQRWLTLFGGAKCVLPLYLYDHSGISMSVGHAGDNPFDSAGWDSSNVGFIYATEEGIAECCGEGDEYRTEAWLEPALRGEVEYYDSWLRGEVYSYTVEAPDGEVLDSCGGYVGDVKYAIEEAVAAAKCEAETLREKDTARHAAWARARMVAA